MSKGRKKFLVISTVAVALLFVSALTVSYCRTGKIGLEGVTNFFGHSWQCEYKHQSNCTYSQTGNTYGKLDDLLIINRSDQPLMAMVTKGLADSIAKAEIFTSIRCVDAREAALGLMEPTPDFVLDLNFQKLKRGEEGSSILYSGTVNMFVGSGPLGGNSNSHTGMKSLCFSFGMEEILDFEAKCVGWGPRDSELGLVSENLAKSLAEVFIKPLKKIKQEVVALPKMPANFYGKGNASEPNTLAKNNALCLMKTGGLLRHRESFWLIESKADKEKVLAKLVKSLKAEGYVDPDASFYKKYPQERTLWTMRKGDKRVEIKEKRQPVRTGVWVCVDPEKEKVTRLEVMFSHWFSKGELKAAIDSMIKAEPDLNIDRLLPFARAGLLPEKQTQDLFAKMLTSPNVTSKQCLVAAKFAWGQKKNEQARRLLRKALCYSGMLTTNDVRRVAQEYKDEKELEKPFTIEEVAGYGLQDLTKYINKGKFKFTGTKSFRLCWKEKDGNIGVMHFCVRPAASGAKNDFCYIKEGMTIQPSGNCISIWSKNTPMPVDEEERGITPSFIIIAGEPSARLHFSIAISKMDTPGEFCLTGSAETRDNADLEAFMK